MPTHVAIVPHTHWDREWYSPFQTFRLQLVELIDELLELLERDPGYRRFMLDGQTAVIDDYLEIRPEAEPRLRSLMAQGRLSVGPWEILMDEYMVSGETMIRSLQRGIARAIELGGLMEVGYLPDMFGHVAQMPQMLSLAGLRHCVVWRGVPNAVTQTAFWWQSPDGTRVRAEYLYGSYSNGRNLPNDPAQLLARIRGYELEMGDAALVNGSVLLMNGTDHQLPQAWLGEVVARANALQDDYTIEVSSLPEYLPIQPTDALNTWCGELRSGARSNVLMGVASNRIDVHRACAAAERTLERRAEPLSALFLIPERYPHPFVDEAWRQLVLNSAHDSSCACSADEVVDEVLVRYRTARQIGDGLAGRAIAVLGAEIIAPDASTLVVNPTQHDRCGLIAVRVPGTGPVHFIDADDIPCVTQTVSEDTPFGFSATVIGQKVRWVLEMMRGPEFAGTNIARYERTWIDDAILDLRFYGARPGEDFIDLQEIRDELAALAVDELTFRFAVLPPPVREVLVQTTTVPGLGWSTLRAVEGVGPTSALAVTNKTLSNEHLHLTIDPQDGTFSIVTRDGIEVHGANRYVSGGDGGDTYNYSPPEHDLVVDRPTNVVIETLDTGPARIRARITSTYSWPTHAVGDMISCSHRAPQTTEVVIETTLELRIGERFVRVHTELDNKCRDHRLRAHFPLPAVVDGSDAECAFAVVHRGLTAEGGPNEFGLPTFVSRRFVDCSAPTLEGRAGVALLHDGLLEYEVVDDGRELALTLLRATGFLSRAGISLRPNPAGPLMELRGPQLLGRHVVEYAVMPHRGDWRDVDCYARADEMLSTFEVGYAGGIPGAFRELRAQCLRIEGAQVSAVFREGQELSVRAFNASAETSVVTIERAGVAASGWTVDLRGRPDFRFDGTLTLRPWEIVTMRLSD